MEIFTIPLEAVVTVAGFTCLLWWVPKTELRALPALSALIFAPYWVEAALYAYVTVLMFGTLFTLLEGVGMFNDS